MLNITILLQVSFDICIIKDRTFDTNLYIPLPLVNAVTKEVIKLFPDKKNITILDVGAGTGQIGKLLNESGFTSIDATDASRIMLDEAEKLKVYQNLYHESLEENKKFHDGYKDNYYDLIVSAGSFYPFHLTGNHLHCLISCVKPNGYLVISSAPADDEGVDLSTTLKRLQNEGILTVVEGKYYTNV